MPFEEPTWIFPFEGMGVGDSFFIPTLRPAHLIYVVDTRAKAAGIRIKCFITEKEGHFGLRVWRMA